MLNYRRYPGQQCSISISWKRFRKPRPFDCFAGSALVISAYHRKANRARRKSDCCPSAYRKENGLCKTRSRLSPLINDASIRIIALPAERLVSHHGSRRSFTLDEKVFSFISEAPRVLAISFVIFYRDYFSQSKFSHKLRFIQPQSSTRILKMRFKNYRALYIVIYFMLMIYLKFRMCEIFYYTFNSTSHSIDARLSLETLDKRL